MPNGGTDCCGTCWFNLRNGGKAGHPEWVPSDQAPAPCCEIREFSIDDPFYTYCANHPLRRPERDPIPIGPVTRVNSHQARVTWLPSPDSEEIRLHLLELLDDFPDIVFRDPGIVGAGVGEMVLHQLAELTESRAEEKIRWISENMPRRWADVARTALARIASARKHGPESNEL